MAFDGDELLEKLSKGVRDLKAKTDEVTGSHEELTLEMKKFGKQSDETKLNADKALAELNTLSAQITEIEQKLVSKFDDQNKKLDDSKTLGQRLTGEEHFVKYAKERGSSGRCHFKLKTVTQDMATRAATLTTVTTGPGNSGQIIRPDRLPGVLMLPDYPLMVRDLISPGQTDNNAIEWIRETGFTNAAAMVSENPAFPKPQSDIRFDKQTTTVSTMAHFIMASKQALADIPMLSGMIDGRLRYGLMFAEDQQLLLGDGTGDNLLGIMPQATAYADPLNGFVKNPTVIDILRMAMLQQAVALYPATGHVLHPIDWAKVELTKDSMNRYILGNPTGTIGATLWNLPVVTTQAMPVGWFLTGAFKLACQIFDREDANVLISTEDRDNFVKNMVTILAEERLGLAVYRPQAMIKGQFSTVTTGS